MRLKMSAESEVEPSVALTPKSVSDSLGRIVTELRAHALPDQHQWDRTRIIWRDAGYEMRWSTRPDFTLLLAMRTDAADLLTSVRELSTAIQSDPRYAAMLRAVPNGPWLQLQPHNVALHATHEYLGQLHSLHHDESIARSVAVNLIESLNERTVEVTLFTVLRGLRCDFPIARLSGDLVLRTLTEEQAEDLVDRFPHLVENDNLPLNRCLLEWKTRASITDPPGDDFIKAGERFADVVTALRLLKKGRVEVEHTYRRLDHRGQIDMGGGYAGHMNKRYPISRTYDLAEREVADLKELLRAVVSGKVPMRLRTAIDRVDFAAERNRPEDRLVDAITAIEALFGDGSGGIEYKIGLRCAVFVEDDPSRREGIRDLVKVAYKRRSAVVHGGRRSNTADGDKDERLVEELLALIRRGVSRMAGAVLKGNTIPGPKEIDDLILHGVAKRPSSEIS